MLHQHTREQLSTFNRPQLWNICRERGLKCYPKSADCIEAICLAQQSVEKVAIADVKVDDAPQTEEITTVEITFYDHEVYASGKQIATITHDMDDFQTQRWVVMVGETEIHRADSWAKCHSYIQWHYKQGTLQAFLSIDSYLKPETECEVESEPEVIEIDEYKLVYAGGKSPKNYLVYKGDVLRGMIWEHLNYWSNGIDNIRHNQPMEAAAGLDELIDDETASYEELLDKPFDELTTAEWGFIKQHSTRTRYQLEQAYQSDNFGCYNRVGGRVKGNEFIKKERRRVASGELVMVCCDIAGMGDRNIEIGEVAVNQAVRSCLKQIRTWRGMFFISQLNSGDEFVFIVDRVDAIGIIPRMDDLFKSAGFDGIYGALQPINDDYITAANDGMKLVYKLKEFARQL